MVKKKYIPERGDIVWVDFSPQRGREQADRRPALILSPKMYNGKVGLALACPVTSRAKSYPFEVAIGSSNVRGVVLADQIHSLDWKERRTRFIAKVTPMVLGEVKNKVISLLVGEE